LNQAKVSQWEGDKTKLPARFWGVKLDFTDGERIQRISNPSMSEFVIQGMNLNRTYSLATCVPREILSSFSDEKTLS
jgi:hypothetical protein